MTGRDLVQTASFSETRAQAAVAARRYGVPRTMIETATRRRASGDWRGSCAAADVDVYLNPDSLRAEHGAALVERLLADLRSLAPDLLRWHFPRCGHGAGLLRGGILLPLADYPGSGKTLTLAAATPPVALAAGQRIVLTVLENGTRDAVLHGVHRSTAERYDLRRHRMFWDAAHAPRLRGLLGEAAEREPTHFLTTVPVNLPSLIRRARAALPGTDAAVIRMGGAGVILLRGLEGSPRSTGTAEVVTAEVVTALQARGLPVVPEVAWMTPVDAELLCRGLMRPQELHPLVAAALAPDSLVDAAFSQHEELVYRTVPGIEATCPDWPGTAAVEVRCGSTTHRVARLDGTWRPVDHDDQPVRERLLASLGGAPNPCLQATRHLNSGRHVIETVASLLEHGRADECMRLLRTHADVTAAPEDIALPYGGTVGEALDTLHANTLRLRMILAGAKPLTWTRFTPRHHPDRRSRKGEPARPHR